MESSLSLPKIWEEEAFLKIHATEMKAGNVVHILGDMPSNSNYVGTSNLLKLEATGGS